MSTGGISEGNFPDNTEIIRALTLPDGWGVIETETNREIGGYSVIATLEDSGGEQGLLLADREYRRVACILYPVRDSFRKYTIEASQTVSDAQLSNRLNCIEEELESRDEK